METQYADLEINLHPGGGDGEYGLAMRFSQADRPAEMDLLGGQAVGARIDPQVLGDPLGAPASYGNLLFGQLFQDRRALRAFEKAIGLAEGAGQGLRLRLSIMPAAGELHRLAWETLADPDEGGVISMRENVLFSRFQGVNNERGIRPLGQGPLCPVICAAAPENLAEHPLAQLAEIDAQSEIARVEQEMSEAPRINLGDARRLGGTYGPASLASILDALRARPACDILYLVSHGGLSKTGQFALILEDDQHRLVRVPGEEFAQALAGLETLPRLVVLIACYGGAFAGKDTRTALGARLVEAGVPAVIAMQTQFSMETAKIFLPAFFKELSRDGLIDRAAAVARRKASACRDFWVPSLIMGLKNGRLWQDLPVEKGAKYNIHIQSVGTVIQGDHPVVNIRH